MNISYEVQFTLMNADPETIHIEYDIRSISQRGNSHYIDILQTNLEENTGHVWEVKPLANWDGGATQVRGYLAQLAIAKQAKLLIAKHPSFENGQEDWNTLSWSLGTPMSTIPFFVGRDPSGWWEFWAAHVEPGLIVWWKYQLNPKVDVKDEDRLNIPGKSAWTGRNTPGWVPGMPAPSKAAPPSPLSGWNLADFPAILAVCWPSLENGMFPYNQPSWTPGGGKGRSYAQ